MAVNLNSIDDTVALLDMIVEDTENISSTIVEELLNNIYKLTYNIQLSNIKGVRLIDSQKKAIFTQFLKDNVFPNENDDRFTAIEHKLYKILYLLKIIDSDSYAVLYKIL